MIALHSLAPLVKALKDAADSLQSVDPHKPEVGQLATQMAEAGSNLKLAASALEGVVNELLDLTERRPEPEPLPES